MTFSDLLKQSVAALGSTAEFKALCSHLLTHSRKARVVLLDVLPTLIGLPDSTLTAEQVEDLRAALLDGYDAD